MKMVKNIAIIAVAASFMFGSVNFHYANNYTDMANDTVVETSYGVTYELNGSTSVGWDSSLGMMMYFAVPNTSATLRMGWTAEDALGADGLAAGDDGTRASTSMGLGYTWWSGGDGIKTSLSTNFDYVMAPDADAVDAGGDFSDTQEANSTNLSVTVGFGF
jgi:hypothetical protein